MSNLQRFINNHKSNMLKVLVGIVKREKTWINNNLHEYSETEVPGVDIRLCIDLHDSSWIFYTGLADYDQRHSEYCSASCIGLDTNALTLLTELIDQIEE